MQQAGETSVWNKSNRLATGSPAFGFEWSVGDKVCTVRGVAPPITGRQTERKIKSRDVLSEHSESAFITCLLYGDTSKDSA